MSSSPYISGTRRAAAQCTSAWCISNALIYRFSCLTVNFFPSSRFCSNNASVRATNSSALFKT